MSTAMDMFLSSSDSLPFPDILDIDIKSEIETLGGDSDFSCYNLSSQEPLLFEDVEDLKWFNANSTQSVLDFSNDDTMVNPNAVMPVMSINSSMLRSPSPAVAQSQSHLAFSPSALKVATLKADAASVKKNLSKLDDTDLVRERTITFSNIKPITKITPILAKSNLRPLSARTSTAHSLPTLLLRNKQITTPVMTQVANITTIRTIPTTTISQTITRKTVPVTKAIDNDDERIYPKPGYSYSCLIAMALKNSKTGSLPVSEIYGFMCKHFPYFKTAPNGWKNSVRHNLSLNKCFEKIEKHALNGAQRKGCLWAMNPAKILKMDEEVQKWSRKDPNAIRKAMSNPENLDALERGELKFSCSYSENENFGDPCGSADSGEGSDSDEEIQENVETEVTDIDVDEEQYHYIQVSDEDSEEYEEVTEYQSGDDGIEEDKKLLEVEMALAQEELLKYENYEKPISEKKKRTYYMEC